MNEWLHELRRLVRDGQTSVLVTVAGARGSTPREVGAKMIVTATETIGTIGGGQLEYQSVQEACEWLQNRDTQASESVGRSMLRKYTLGANCGQCCGGVVELLFEEIAGEQTAWVKALSALDDAGVPAAMITSRQSRTNTVKVIVTSDGWNVYGDELKPDEDILAIAREKLLPGSGASREVAKPGYNVKLPVLIEPVCSTNFRVIIFGAGHVGAACATVLSTLDAQVDLVDSRPMFLEGQFPPNVRPVAASDVAAVVATIPAHSFYLVMTHDHALDFEICSRILKRRDAAFCGLIGSRSKRRRFEKRLRALGFAEPNIDSLTCPIGVDEISGKKPAHIAIAVAAQLLGLYEQGIHTGFDRNSGRGVTPQQERAIGGTM